MKTKKLFLAALCFAAGVANAQITPSMTIPNPIPNYDGSYDDFGQNHLFYPNGGEVRYANADQDDAGEEVLYYTMNTYPKQYLLSNNNISLCYSKPNTGSTGSDSLQRIDMEWSGSTTTAFLARVDTQNTAVLNYFTQWFGSSGRTGVKGGAAIACQSVYQNIDLVYTSNNAGLVMYFIVYPGGNFNSIRMHLNGSKANSIVSNKLKIEANWEYTTFEKPQMYQYTYVSNVVTPVNIGNADWQNVGTDLYKITSTSSYNTSLPLIIQLKQGNASQAVATGLDWSTYFGGWQSEFLTKTHCDANDNLYIAGYSNSANSTFPQNPGVGFFPNNNGDGAIAKFNNAGVLQWSTFVGGSSTDEIHDFDFNGNNITCVGKTGSTDLGVQTKTGATNNGSFFGGNWDGFIFEFTFNSSTSQIVPNWLTYFGGNGDEELNACKFDASGNLFVAGEGASTNMTPMGPGGSYQVNFNSAQLSASGLSTDGIIARFNTSSLQSWFTFYGTDQLGTNANTFAADYFYGIAIDGSNVYACGKAGGTNLPQSTNSKLVSGSSEGILVRFTTSGVLNANSAKYTDGNIANYALKVLWNDVYTVGEANSSMSPVNSGLYYYNGTASGNSDGCFSVHSQNLSSTTIHNSFLGGNADDAAYDIQFTSNGLFMISGGTSSSNFPVNSLGTMYAGSTPGLNDNFLAGFQKNNTNMIWSCYLGSSGWQESLQYPPAINSQYNMANTAIALNSQNDIYVLGSTTSFNTFPLDQWTGSPVYYQSAKSGGMANDGTLTRLTGASLSTVIGLNDFENTEFVFGLYPNPTVNTISITNTAISNDDLRYAIYDMSGKKLKEGSFKANEQKNIDVSMLQQGAYIINAGNGKKTFSNKFIKTEN